MYKLFNALRTIRFNLKQHIITGIPAVASPMNSFRLYPHNYCTTTQKQKSVYLVDEDEYPPKSTSSSKNVVNKFTNRSHTCGELNTENVGESVTLCGWLEFQRMNKFAVMRDSYGRTQLLFKDNETTITQALEKLPYESIIQIQGTVLARPVEMRNQKLATGDIEVLVDCLTVLNRAKEKLPFNIREFQRAKEALRMQYRYLDLRFPLMQHNLRTRSEVIAKMREFLVNHCNFVDVETPTLFKATPGGAQEFIVPTRFPGEFYSLVQSPQQFKQMLMAGAVDRYFQIARCYRDEGARPDRQPEFTQLDIEMSFTNLDKILELVEGLLGHSWPQFLDPLPVKFPRMSFKDAMESYGTDQPDVRYQFLLQNCTDVVGLNKNLVTCDNFSAYCLQFPKEYANLSRGFKDKLSELEKKFPSATLVKGKVTTSSDSKVGKLLTEPVALKLASQINLSDDSVLFLAYGDKSEVLKLLGKVRVDYVDNLESLGINVMKKGMHLLWVLDFPLFEPGSNPGQLQSAHHPFTSPHLDDLRLLDESPLDVRALSFDLVLNGNEIGGGSVRIHDPELQQKVFDMLRIDRSSMSHIIDMLSSGCPPHGGIALGLDRLMSKLLNTTSIRDVIAFPKTFEGRDPLSGAPSRVSEEDQKLYHIKSLIK